MDSFWEWLRRLVDLWHAVGILVLACAAVAGWLGLRRFWSVGNGKDRTWRPGQARAVCVIAYDGKQVLMVKRRKKGGDPLSWYFPSGHLAESEVAPIQAVKEVFEETGVNVEFESELGTRLHPDTKFFIHYVICRYKAGEPRNLEPHENEAVEWVSANSAPNRITTDLDPRVRDFLIGL